MASQLKDGFLKKKWGKKFIGAVNQHCISPQEKLIFLSNSGKTISQKHGLNKILLINIDGITVKEKDYDLIVYFCDFINEETILLFGHQFSHNKFLLRTLNRELEQLDEKEISTAIICINGYEKNKQLFQLKQSIQCKNGENMWEAQGNILLRPNALTYSSFIPVHVGQKTLGVIDWDGKYLWKKDFDLDFCAVRGYGNKNIVCFGFDNFDDSPQQLYCFNTAGKLLFEKEVPAGVRDILITEENTIFVTFQKEQARAGGMIALDCYGKILNQQSGDFFSTIATNGKTNVIAIKSQKGLYLFSPKGSLLAEEKNIEGYDVTVSRSGRFILTNNGFGYDSTNFSLVESELMLLKNK